jgi:hypothetical protein
LLFPVVRVILWLHALCQQLLLHCLQCHCFNGCVLMSRCWFAIPDDIDIEPPLHMLLCHLGIFLARYLCLWIFPISYCWVLRVVDFGHQSIIRYAFYSYFLQVCGLSFHCPKQYLLQDRKI